MRGFIGIWGYKKWYLIKLGMPSKNRFFFIGNMYWEWSSTKGFGRYLSIFSEINGII